MRRSDSVARRFGSVNKVVRGREVRCERYDCVAGDAITDWAVGAVAASNSDSVAGASTGTGEGPMPTIAIFGNDLHEIKLPYIISNSLSQTKYIQFHSFCSTHSLCSTIDGLCIFYQHKDDIVSTLQEPLLEVKSFHMICVLKGQCVTTYLTVNFRD